MSVVYGLVARMRVEWRDGEVPSLVDSETAQAQCYGETSIDHIYIAPPKNYQSVFKLNLL